MRAQATKILNEVMALIESGCKDRTVFRKILDELVASREELRRINADHEDAVPVEDLEAEYKFAADFYDQTLEAMTRFQCRLEELSVGSTVKASPSTALDMPLSQRLLRPRASDLVSQRLSSSLFMETCVSGRRSGSSSTEQSTRTRPSPPRISFLPP